MEMRSPPSPRDVESNLSPVKTDISTINTRTSDGFKVEKVSKDKTFQLKKRSLDEEVPSWEFEESDIKQMDYRIEPVSPLGAYDKHGNYYADALPEGGEISLGGVHIPIEFGRYFEESGFSIFSPELKIGKVFPFMAYIPNNEYGKAFIATNFPELHQGTQEKKIYTDTRGEVPLVYMIIPTIVGYPNSIFPDKIEDGQKINEIPQGFKIQTSGLTQTDTGYLGWKVIAVREMNDKFMAEDLGYLKDNVISIDPEDLPEEVRIAIGSSN